MTDQKTPKPSPATPRSPSEIAAETRQRLDTGELTRAAGAAADAVRRQPEAAPTGTGPVTGAPGPAPATPSVGAMLGEICFLMSQSSRHRHFFLADLEWMVIPALRLGQVRLFRNGPNPVGVALWARVSPEVAARLEEGVERLKPGDWASGDITWLVELIAPYGGEDAMIADLKATSLQGVELRMRKVGGKS